MNRTSLIALLVVLVSCKQNHQDKKTLEFSAFTIEVPETWRHVRYDGIDSGIDQILTDGGDSINVEYGNHSAAFDDVIKVYSLKDKAHFDSINWPTQGKIFSKSPVVDEMQGIYMQEYYMYDTIDSHRAKLMMPKKIGQGDIGVYFDSLDSKGNKLTLYGSRLDTMQHFAMLRAIESIQFKKK
jgi:hypothetical protein